MAKMVLPKKVVWEPISEKQGEMLARTEFEILAGGARGGTKSESGRAWLLKPFAECKLEELKHYRALVLRKNAEDLKGWIDKAKVMYGYWGAKIVGRPAEIRFPQGPIFWCGHLADKESYEKYQGNEYHRLLFEELTQQPEESLYLKVVASCRTTISRLYPQIFATANPGGPGHGWVKKRWRIPDTDPPYGIIRTEIKSKVNGIEVDRSRVFVPATVEDNPYLMQNDPGYVLFLESLPEDLRKAWRFGHWNVFFGQFFDLGHRHKIEPFKIPGNWDLFGAMDYGTGPKNATSFGLYTVDPRDNRKLRVGEYYKHELSAPEYAREIMSELEANKWTGGRLPQATFCDPSMWVKAKIDEAYSPSPIESFPFLNPIPANNDRINGWRRSKQLLKGVDDKPEFYYFSGENPRFEEYIPAQIYAKTGNLEDLQKCDIDHIADEFRYFCMGVSDPGEFDIKDMLQPQEEYSISEWTF